MISFQTSILIATACLAAVVVISLAFWRVIRRMPGASAADKIAAWEACFKAITTVAAIVAGLFAFLKYIDQREMELAAEKHAAAQQVREFNITIYGRSTSSAQAKRILFNEAVDLGSTLASLDNLKGPDGIIAADRFERLYHGQLLLYEGRAVSYAMIDFRDALLKWQRTGIKPTALSAEERSNEQEPLSLSKHNSDFMKQLAVNLSSACRGELDALEKSDESAANESGDK